MTYLYGINSRGVAVGSVLDASYNAHGVIYANGDFRTIDLGPSGGQTYLASIDEEDEIVGVYSNITDNYIKSYRIFPGGSVKLLMTSPYSSYRTIVAIN